MWPIWYVHIFTCALVCVLVVVYVIYYSMYACMHIHVYYVKTTQVTKQNWAGQPKLNQLLI